MTTESGGNLVDAYVAFGSNLGDRQANMRAAFQRLVVHDCVTFMARSGLYETAPVGGPPGQDPYLNAAVAVRTSLAPEALLAHCLKTESDLGRVRHQPCSPRTIDLDLLLYGDHIVDRADLSVPHPRMHLRSFVLVPLAEIAPGIPHPTLRCNVLELLRRLPPIDRNLGRAYATDWSTPQS